MRKEQGSRSEGGFINWVAKNLSVGRTTSSENVAPLASPTLGMRFINIDSYKITMGSRDHNDAATAAFQKFAKELEVISLQNPNGCFHEVSQAVKVYKENEYALKTGAIRSADTEGDVSEGDTHAVFINIFLGKIESLQEKFERGALSLAEANTRAKLFIDIHFKVGSSK